MCISHPAVSTALQPPSSITQGATTTTSVSVSWSQVLGATGYYVSYQRQDLGAPPVVTPQYERIVGGDNTSVTLSGLEPGTTYRIRVWSTDGTSVSSGARERDVTTMENSENCYKYAWVQENIHLTVVLNTTTVHGLWSKGDGCHNSGKWRVVCFIVQEKAHNCLARNL